jgi:hypothetical protein
VTTYRAFLQIISMRTVVTRAFKMKQLKVRMSPVYVDHVSL